MSNAQKVGAINADRAMHQIWAEWFAFYDKHFRGPGIAISAADQMAFYEIAQPILHALRAAPTPDAHSEVGVKAEGFNGGYNADGTWRWHVFNPGASPLEKKQVELDCMTRLKVIQEGQTEHHRLRAEAAEERVMELEALTAGVVKAEPVAWQHPSAGWVHHDRQQVAMHCRTDGPGPIPLYAALASKPEVKAEPVAWLSDSEFIQWLDRAYNHPDGDGRDFTRWNMKVAFHAGANWARGHEY